MTNSRAEQALALPEALHPWITGIVTVSAAGPPGTAFTHLPDAATKIVVRVGTNGQRDVLAVGPRVRATYHDGEVLASCVELRLAPGTARPLLGVPAAELLGRVVPLGELPGRTAHQLNRELRWLTAEETAAHLAATLPERLTAAADRTRTALVRAGADAMSVRVGQTPGPVSEVARELAVSERHLRNLFAEGVGLSPKHYARINRVRAVLTHAATADWAELAAATGYYDQSHMTSDFRALMGVPPRSYFTGRLPAATPCQSVLPPRLRARPSPGSAPVSG
ncbi:AraC family transcriptional regulator [Streptomyces sp. NK08204]|uniref:AraC family transcriptional regulator n=1 Tax=Streptomyces sp. NK08204 TaxID=2873260 RepID=UPI001CEDA3E6|nr:AraC family transcriptional regulator [Streptomyces sp. NK08204]